MSYEQKVHISFESIFKPIHVTTHLSELIFNPEYIAKLSRIFYNSD